MKINDERKSCDSLFESLNIGDVFEFSHSESVENYRNVFIRTNQTHGQNALRLSDSEVIQVNSILPVRKLNATLTIEDK